MSRDYAQLLHVIWSDPHFLALDGEAQRAYMMLLSQSSMNYAGVLDLTVRRWAKYSSDSTVDSVRGALDRLADEPGRFLLVDEDTEEVLVRSFIRNDGLWKNVRMLGVALRHAEEVQSPALRATLAVELARLPRVVIPPAEARGGRAAAEAIAVQQHLDALVVHLGGDNPGGPGQGAAAPSDQGLAQGLPQGLAQGVAQGAGVGAGAGAVVGAGAVGAFPSTTSEENDREVDARGRTRPTTLALVTDPNAECRLHRGQLARSCRSCRADALAVS